MLQNLLADRFGLTVHKDNKQMPAYVLTVGKGAPKLKPGSGPMGCQGQPPSGPPAPGVVPNNVVSCHNMTMVALADQLHLMANGYVGDHPVADATKLEGAWDFDLMWTPRGALTAPGSDGISIFDAVDKQLGLKLDLQTISMPVVVVDKVNQKPTANLAGVGSSVPDAPVEFEAADIKPSAPGSQGFRFLYQPGGRINGEGALRDFVAAALGIPPNLSADLLVGVPKPLESARFEIIAKTPATGIGAATHDGGRDAPPPLSVALVMLHALLTDRFKLVTHTEDQMATVYAIIAPRGGTKLKKADTMERASCNPDANAPAIGAAGAPSIAYRCQNTTMAELAEKVQQWAGGYFDHPAVDATGLEGGWDFVLSWTPKGALHPAQTGDPSAGIAADPGGLSVFEAMDKELGLKVDLGKHTIPVTVIDHMELKPTDN
jgi:uncharacterized protein (TIGR03435 family)